MNGILGGIAFLFKGGFVMYPLLASGLVALTVIIERLLVLNKKLHTAPEEIRSVIKKAQAGEVDLALSEAQKGNSPIMKVIAVGLGDKSGSSEDLELKMKVEAEGWLPVIEKRMQIIDTIITAAPLMGLLGTITGMMGSFQVLSDKGVNEPNAITGGVAEALIATATGLVIALLCLVAFNYLNQKIKNIIAEMEGAASNVLSIKKSLQRVKS